MSAKCLLLVSSVPFGNWVVWQIWHMFTYFTSTLYGGSTIQRKNYITFKTGRYFSSFISWCNWYYVQDYHYVFLGYRSCWQYLKSEYQKKIRVFYAEFKHLLHIVSKYVIIRLCHSVVIVTKTKRYTKIKKVLKINVQVIHL